jgi:hypothetical protein
MLWDLMMQAPLCSGLLVGLLGGGVLWGLKKLLTDDAIKPTPRNQIPGPSNYTPIQSPYTPPPPQSTYTPSSYDDGKHYDDRPDWQIIEEREAKEERIKEDWENSLTKKFIDSLKD